MSKMSSSINLNDDKDIKDEEDKKENKDKQYIDIKPTYNEKFKVGKLKDSILEILTIKLENITSYNNEHIQSLNKEIAESIREKLKSKESSRYKYIINIQIGEKKNQGITVVNRCFWDSDTDNYLSIPFYNDYIFCCATIYGIYIY